MILSYNNDRFVEGVKKKRKIHSLRRDPKRRWKAGMKIQHWRGNPRNVRAKPYHFDDGECKSVQETTINRNEDQTIEVIVDGRLLTDAEIENLAKNDDLSVSEFKEYFVPHGVQKWEGRIIHFTDLKY